MWQQPRANRPVPTQNVSLSQPVRTSCMGTYILFDLRRFGLFSCSFLLFFSFFRIIRAISLEVKPSAIYCFLTGWEIYNIMACINFMVVQRSDNLKNPPSCVCSFPSCLMVICLHSRSEVNKVVYSPIAGLRWFKFDQFAEEKYLSCVCRLLVCKSVITVDKEQNTTS